MGDRLREAISPATDALAALAARLTELAQSPEPPPQRTVTEDEVISLEKASPRSDPKVPDAELGVFAWPADRPAPSCGE